MKRFSLLLIFTACASASSTWQYAFSDTFCSECKPVGFTFVENATLSISHGTTFWLAGSQLSSCETQNPDLQCQGINLYWRNDGLLQVSLFLQSSAFPLDWEPPIEAHFVVPGLNVEGMWTNSISVAPWGLETQTFSIIDPVSAPEPGAWPLTLMGLAVAIFLGCRSQRFPVSATLENLLRR